MMGLLIKFSDSSNKNIVGFFLSVKGIQEVCMFNGMRIGINMNFGIVFLLLFLKFFFKSANVSHHFSHFIGVVCATAINS